MLFRLLIEYFQYWNVIKRTWLILLQILSLDLYRCGIFANYSNTVPFSDFHCHYLPYSVTRIQYMFRESRTIFIVVPSCCS
jgi:hypothetical protein